MAVLGLRLSMRLASAIASEAMGRQVGNGFNSLIDSNVQTGNGNSFFFYK